MELADTLLQEEVKDWLTVVVMQRVAVGLALLPTETVPPAKLRELECELETEMPIDVEIDIEGGDV